EMRENLLGQLVEEGLAIGHGAVVLKRKAHVGGVGLGRRRDGGADDRREVGARQGRRGRNRGRGGGGGCRRRAGRIRLGGCFGLGGRGGGSGSDERCQ